MQLVSAAENTTLDWKAHYKYIEYNVEGNEKDNRGYTGGIVGFTSKTGDMFDVVERFEIKRQARTSPLDPYIKVLKYKNEEKPPTKEDFGESSRKPGRIRRC